MAEEDSPAVMEDVEREALTQVNAITLKQISSKLDANPILDLSELLKQQAISYPRLRNVLARAARQRALAAPNVATKSHTSYNDAKSRFLLNGEVRVIIPLQSVVCNLLSSNRSTPGVGPLLTLNDDAVADLNKAIATAQVLSDYGGTSVLDLGSSVAVKVGRSFDSDHIATLQYIKSHAPMVPAPDVVGLIETDRQIYLFMSRAPGFPLEKQWSKLIPSQKVAIQQQLDEIFRTVRTIPWPHPSAGPGFGDISAKCKDMRKSARIATHLKSEVEFNEFLCTSPGRSNTPWIRMIHSSMRDDHAIVLTHGDLHPRNIMVVWEEAMSDGDTSSALTSDIRITSILDWEMSGWYPEYWEFVKALNTVGPRDGLRDWCDYLPIDAIGTWPVEYAIDLLISRWLG